MNAKCKGVFLTVASICSFLLIATLFLGLWRGCGVLDESRGFDRTLHRAFKALRNGTPAAEVFGRMRDLPIWTNSQFTLGQYEGNEKEYTKTNGVNAIVFYTWANGIDWFYCVGFSQDGLLVVKGEGGT